jgi:hypothetical protein
MNEINLDGEDWEWERTIFSPICTFCAHLTNITDRKCKAFPDGIPREIWLGKNNHMTPYPGDHGIQFERKKMS